MTLAELQWKALGPPERALWRIVRLICRAEDASAGTLHLATIDLRSTRERYGPNLKQVTSQALERISAARGGFGELVTGHLRIVAVVPGRGRARAIQTRPRMYARPRLRSLEIAISGRHNLSGPRPWYALHAMACRHAGRGGMQEFDKPRGMRKCVSCVNLTTRALGLSRSQPQAGSRRLEP